MEHHRKSSHTTYDLKYHLVWITKYRKPVLSGEMSKRVRDLIREICCTQDVEILNGHISRDHVHIFVSVPPHVLISRPLQSIKGKSSPKVLSEFKPLSRAWGYFVASSGTVTDEAIMQYIELQGKELHDGDFHIDGNL